MRNVLKLAAGAAFGLGLSAGAASAQAVITAPLQAQGDVYAIFGGAFASDTSSLTWGPTATSATATDGGTVIFANNLTETVGTTVFVTNYPSLADIFFALNNITQGNEFVSGVDTGETNPQFAAQSSTTWAGLSGIPDAEPAAVTTARNALLAINPGFTFLYVGFEDRVGGDQDRNDLIYVFTSVRPREIEVPAPAAFAIFGLGLAGLGLALRRNARA